MLLVTNPALAYDPTVPDPLRGFGWHGRTRTYNHPVNSRELYLLSYMPFECRFACYAGAARAVPGSLARLWIWSEIGESNSCSLLGRQGHNHYANPAKTCAHAHRNRPVSVPRGSGVRPVARTHGYFLYWKRADPVAEVRWFPALSPQGKTRQPPGRSLSGRVLPGGGPLLRDPWESPYCMITCVFVSIHAPCGANFE